MVAAIPPLRLADPRAVEPLVNVTVPVAEEGETVAVMAKACPGAEGFAEDDTLIVAG